MGIEASTPEPSPPAQPAREGSRSDRRLEFCAPTPGDAAEIWQLVAGTPRLDANSPYAYLLLCSHFASTGVVAREAGALLGFVLGYVRPDDRETAFVWQVAVAPAARGRGLGGRLLDAWYARCARQPGVRFLEATVTRSNEASSALFAGFARRHGVPLAEDVRFAERLFPDEVPHEAELGLRLGPIPEDADLTRVAARAPEVNR